MDRKLSALPDGGCSLVPSASCKSPAFLLLFFCAVGFPSVFGVSAPEAHGRAPVPSMMPLAPTRASSTVARGRWVSLSGAPGSVLPTALGALGVSRRRLMGGSTGLSPPGFGLKVSFVLY